MTSTCNGSERFKVFFRTSDVVEIDTSGNQKSLEYVEAMVIAKFAEMARSDWIRTLESMCDTSQDRNLEEVVMSMMMKLFACW